MEEFTGTIDRIGGVQDKQSNRKNRKTIVSIIVSVVVWASNHLSNVNTIAVNSAHPPTLSITINLSHQKHSRTYTEWQHALMLYAFHYKNTPNITTYTPNNTKLVIKPPFLIIFTHFLLFSLSFQLFSLSFQLFSLSFLLFSLSFLLFSLSFLLFSLSFPLFSFYFSPNPIIFRFFPQKMTKIVKSDTKWPRKH